MAPPKLALALIAGLLVQASAPGIGFALTQEARDGAVTGAIDSAVRTGRFDQAAALLARMANSGNAEAQYQLGMMLAEGNGGNKDDVAARALFEKAAVQNHPGALERMGAFAQEGRGGPKDSDAAKSYYQRAAALGDEDAKKALERLRCPYAIKDKRGNLVTNLCF